MSLNKNIFITILCYAMLFFSSFADDEYIRQTAGISNWLNRKIDLVLVDLKQQKFTNNHYDRDMFYNFCTEDITEKHYSDDVTVGCNTTFKSGTKVRPAIAEKLIELYLLYTYEYSGNTSKIPSEISKQDVYDLATSNTVCNDEYVYEWGDDFVQCFYHDGEKYHFYDFQFDSITHTDIKDITNNTKDAICRIFGGCDNKEASQCNKMDNLVQPIMGYSVKWNGKNGCSLREVDRKDTHYDSSTGTKLKTQSIMTVDGVNNWKFRHLNVGNASMLTPFLESYVKNQLKNNKNIKPKAITDWRCDGSLTTVTFTEDDVYAYSEVPQADFKADDTVHILRCHISTNAGKASPIDFVFNSLTENSVTEIEGTESALKCLAIDGASFDGQNCFGLGETKCKELRKAMQKAKLKGTKWENDTCVLINAADAEELKTFKDNVSTMGEIAFMAVTLPVSGAGTAATVAAVGLKTTGEAVSATAKHLQKDVVFEVTKLADKCLNGDRDHACAVKTLREILNLNYQSYSINRNQIATLDEKTAQLINLLEPGKLRKNFKTAKIDWFKTAETLGDVMSFVAGFIGGGAVVESKFAKMRGTAAKSKKALQTLITNYNKTYGNLGQIEEGLYIAGEASEIFVSENEIKVEAEGQNSDKTISQNDKGKKRSKEVSQNGNGKIKNRG